MHELLKRFVYSFNKHHMESTITLRQGAGDTGEREGRRPNRKTTEGQLVSVSLLALPVLALKSFPSMGRLTTY